MADNTDCDDTEDTVYPGAEEICDDGLDNDCDGDVDAADSDCSTGCIEREVKIDFNGPLFVAPADEPGSYTWQGAMAACGAKAAADGCDWYLPSKDELNALYVNREAIGGFSTGFYGYWSSSEYAPSPTTHAWDQLFYDGNQYADLKNSDTGNCRCVRR